VAAGVAVGIAAGVVRSALLLEGAATGSTVAGARGAIRWQLFCRHLPARVVVEWLGRRTSVTPPAKATITMAAPSARYRR
jgi:hypothetical protein